NTLIRAFIEGQHKESPMKDSCSCTAQNNDPATIADRPVDLGGDSLRTTVRITQMDCPTEQRLITDRLSGMNGVGQLSFNLLERTLTLQHSPEALEPALQAIRRLGFTPLPVTEPEPAAPPRHWLYARLALAGLLALAAELLHFTAAAADWTVA